MCAPLKIHPMGAFIDEARLRPVFPHPDSLGGARQPRGLHTLRARPNHNRSVRNDDRAERQRRPRVPLPGARKSALGHRDIRSRYRQGRGVAVSLSRQLRQSAQTPGAGSLSGAHAVPRHGQIPRSRRLPGVHVDPRGISQRLHGVGPHQLFLRHRPGISRGRTGPIRPVLHSTEFR